MLATVKVLLPFGNVLWILDRNTSYWPIITNELDLHVAAVEPGLPASGEETVSDHPT